MKNKCSRRVLLLASACLLLSPSMSVLPKFLGSEAFVGASSHYSKNLHSSSSQTKHAFSAPRGGSSSVAPPAGKHHQQQQEGSRGALTRRQVLQTPPNGATRVNDDEDMEHNGATAPMQIRNGASRSSAFRRVPTGIAELSFSSPTTIVNGNHNKLNNGQEEEDNTICAADEPLTTEYVAEANLPTDIGHFRLRAYRVPDDNRQKENQFVGKEPCAIYSTDLPPADVGNAASRANGGVGLRKAVPVRIHDQCFTSEVFRSQRCDCKEQLQMSLNYVQEHGGAVIYLQQEGRGIGLANKVAAYALQDGGMDTVDANIHLGFPEDCRQYGVVPSILKDMGIESIMLMTNNPYKVERLRALGVKVEGTIPMVIKSANLHNRRYLETKMSRMNHTDLEAMLQEEDDNVNGNNGGIPNVPVGGAFGLKNGAMAPRVKPRNGVATGTTTTTRKKAKKMKLVKPPPKEIVQDLPDINNGVKTAANAVAQALLLEDLTQTGVTARKDGYCFGKQSVLDAIAATKRGELVVVVDDENRENEGDFIVAGDMVTPEVMATMIRYTSGVICVALPADRLKELKLPSMVENNEDPKNTAFTVSVDASKKHGITTGISASDRATTIKLMSDPTTVASDFNRPGHIFPLRARDGGTLERDGHTEASVDLARLAGRSPCGVLCEIVSEENPVEMARLPELKRFCKKHGFALTSIVDIAQYRRETEGIDS